MPERLRIVILGLSITSSWGNGHATNYRGLVRALAERGHDVLFLERDLSWYAANRDLRQLEQGKVELYTSLAELGRFEPEVRAADLVILGSYVPQGIEVGEWLLERAGGVRAFYDIDTPVTVASLERGACAYVSPELVPRFDLYLSFTGGPLLRRLERDYGARRARTFYCLVDEDTHRPLDVRTRWDVGYLGTYSRDRQDGVEELLLEPARRLPDRSFVLAGPQYPESVSWPANVEHLEHLDPTRHVAFYCAQRFTLNVTREAMVEAGWSPSVRLFEAAACGVPIITDWWEGLDAFFEPGRDILVAVSTDDVLRYLADVGDDDRRELAQNARRRVLAEHTARRRAAQLELELRELRTAIV